MRSRRVLALAVSMVVLAACNPFNRSPNTEVTRDPNMNSRWRASLVTPTALAGAVQMQGSAAMQPGSNRQETQLSLTIANATPGGLHPWQVHRGQCGADEGVFGPPGSYRAMKVGDEGRGESAATVALLTPTTGNYFVAVYASAANPETVVACGNLAPPAQ